jgi:hypothetical protein
MGDAGIFGLLEKGSKITIFKKILGLFELISGKVAQIWYKNAVIIAKTQTHFQFPLKISFLPLIISKICKKGSS